MTEHPTGAPEVEQAVWASLTDSGGGEDLRSHYLWTLDGVMGNLHPEDLSTSALVALLAVLIPEHARILTTRKPTSPKRSPLRLVKTTPGNEDQ